MILIHSCPKTFLKNAPDGRRYLYNAENRLIAVTPQNPVEGDQRVDFVYDYTGRRVQKIVSTWSSGAWQPGGSNRDACRRECKSVPKTGLKKCTTSKPGAW